MHVSSSPFSILCSTLNCSSRKGKGTGEGKGAKGREAGVKGTRHGAWVVGWEKEAAQGKGRKLTNGKEAGESLR